ncbi:related to integral membrane protein [Fusarium fujikuroi IMI 58289]|uniref:Related to integral membrane protein n=1 Tax=Gibberella fujikuroi (strain CBS 195.34 / IMI 58289 / NRRL A-6831) TaxID=1279085 RepID=S0E743_GIBF5|nr:related to integral membrane protein [Fusarium fujikuroi IMI 58289]KLO89239.1 integral membrane protein [Fusarium fujikuroi]CCT70724.1 related to integral membrane protein [Fusarium fujikuroi IMI 58289]SCO26605.1 related to integral membrane protein [Fusarium fujikuroi]SCO50175.1 related to integral membrane protein [Fusarium fujikuroi]
MSQNNSTPSTPPSTATPGVPTAVIEPSNNINGPKQLANKCCWHVVAMKNPDAKDILVRSALVQNGLVLMVAGVSNTRDHSDDPRHRAPQSSTADTKAKITTQRYLYGGSVDLGGNHSGFLTCVCGPPRIRSECSYDVGGLSWRICQFGVDIEAALLAVYLQVFPEFMVKRRRFLWATIWFVGASYVITVVILFCICLPISRNWDIRPSRTCPKWTYAVTFHVGWGLSFLGDLLALHVRRTLRLGIYFTFLLGTVNMAVSLVRFVVIWKAGADSSISLSTIVLWSTLDVNIGLVVACLPSLRPYFGSRTMSQEQSRESNSWDSSRKHSGFGNRTICFHSKQRGSEAWPSSSGSHARYSSIDQTVVGSLGDTKGFKEANDVELRVLPGARTRGVSYGG